METQAKDPFQDTSNEDKTELLETSNKDMMECNEGEKRYRPQWCFLTVCLFTMVALFFQVLLSLERCHFISLI